MSGDEGESRFLFAKEEIDKVLSELGIQPDDDLNSDQKHQDIRAEIELPKKTYPKRES
ncbi:MAG: hypothetical protein ABJL57_11800 [Hyphomonas sp.]|uniref:hypothetical protein n=1 Tax=Hyphomonas sp. TaxID=87 RepID=UPI00326523C4